MPLGCHVVNIFGDRRATRPPRNSLSRAKNPKRTGRDSERPNSRKQEITNRHLVIVKLEYLTRQLRVTRLRGVVTTQVPQIMCCPAGSLSTRKELVLLILDVYPSCSFGYINFALGIHRGDTTILNLFVLPLLLSSP